MSCYKFVTFDWLMLKVTALACPTSELFIRTNFGQKYLRKRPDFIKTSLPVLHPPLTALVAETPTPGWFGSPMLKR
jgi:hypothetical protein